MNSFKASAYSAKTGPSKVLSPGSQLVRILNGTVWKGKKDPSQINFVFFLEGPEIEDPEFEGAVLDRNNESAGRYRGQVAFRVKARQFPFSWQTKKGEQLKRDENIFKFLTTFARHIGKGVEIDATPEVFSIEEFIELALSVIVDIDNMFWVTLAGEEQLYEGKINTDLYIPSYSTNDRKFPYAPYAETQPDELLEYREEIHFKRLNNSPQNSAQVAGFSGQTAPQTLPVNNTTDPGMSDENELPFDNSDTLEEPALQQAPRPVAQPVVQPVAQPVYQQVSQPVQRVAYQAPTTSQPVSDPTQRVFDPAADGFDYNDINMLLASEPAPQNQIVTIPPVRAAQHPVQQLPAAPVTEPFMK